MTQPSRLRQQSQRLVGSVTGGQVRADDVDRARGRGKLQHGRVSQEWIALADSGPSRDQPKPYPVVVEQSVLECPPRDLHGTRRIIGRQQSFSPGNALF